MKTIYKTALATIVLLGLSVSVSAAKKAKLPPFEPKFGPWIANVTQTSFTVLFTTEYDALVSLEVAPGDDGSEVESEWLKRAVQDPAFKSGHINLKFYDVDGSLTHEYNY